VSNTVIVLGGGVAGLSAAHELCERGFSVRVFEQRRVPGGKARSVAFPSSGRERNVGSVHLGRLAASRRDLPGEHGFRFFPRFYKHIVDTMARIPFPTGRFTAERTVADNLVDTTGTILTRFDQRPLKLPTKTPTTILELFTLVNDLSAIFGPELGIAPEDIAFFGERVWQILTSCSERRQTEYEKLGWWDFIGAADRSDIYQKVFGIGCTRSVVAAQARLASTKTIGDMFVQYFFNLAEPSIGADRVLNGPTNDVWIDPWVDYLRARGVEYHLNASVRSIECAGGRVSGVTVERDRKLEQVQGDYYVSALPVDVMARIVSDQVVRADPSLANIFALSKNTAWMNGIQYYLTQDAPIARGHAIYLDSPWALTSISQRQFWPNVDLSRYGDGTIRGIISVDISDWDTPGLNGKSARECTREEIKDEVWEQLKRSVNVQGDEVIEDEDVRYWFLDADVDPVLNANSEPLLVNLVDTWRLRPTAVTAIPNFFLAADYVQTATDLACMESANEAARRAVNAIIEDSAVSAPLCRIWNLHEPELLEPWRANDRARFRQGLPWDGTVVKLAMHALLVLHRGTAALESSIREVVSTATHVEDVLSYVRTGESRSELLGRLTSGGGEQSAELLRAFAALARSPGGVPAETLASSALDVLSASARSGSGVGGLRFVEP
jgi:uncharacterized protein with NAD-binding domain and iron-sulfur cluster